MSNATLVSCPHCSAIARYDYPKVTNPVMLGVYHPQPLPRPQITRCERCCRYYWIADAAVVSELPFHQAGTAMADVVLTDIGSRPDKVISALGNAERWNEFDESAPAANLPWTIVALVSIESAHGLAAAYSDIGATVEVRPHARHPAWETAPRVRHLMGEEWEEARELGLGTTEHRREHLDRRGR